MRGVGEDMPGTRKHEKTDYMLKLAKGRKGSSHGGVNMGIIMSEIKR